MIMPRFFAKCLLMSHKWWTPPAAPDIPQTEQSIQGKWVIWYGRDMATSCQQKKVLGSMVSCGETPFLELIDWETVRSTSRSDADSTLGYGTTRHSVYLPSNARLVAHTHTHTHGGDRVQCLVSWHRLPSRQLQAQLSSAQLPKTE